MGFCLNAFFQFIVYGSSFSVLVGFFFFFAFFFFNPCTCMLAPCVGGWVVLLSPHSWVVLQGQRWPCLSEQVGPYSAWGGRKKKSIGLGFFVDNLGLRCRGGRRFKSLSLEWHLFQFHTRRTSKPEHTDVQQSSPVSSHIILPVGVQPCSSDVQTLDLKLDTARLTTLPDRLWECSCLVKWVDMNVRAQQV